MRAAVFSLTALLSEAGTEPNFCCYAPKASKLDSCNDCTEKAFDTDGRSDCESSDKDNTWCQVSPVPSPTPPQPPAPHLRVNQLGFAAADEKLAYFMIPSSDTSSTKSRRRRSGGRRRRSTPPTPPHSGVSLVDASSKQIVLSMDLPVSSGGEWNSRYDSVYVLNFTSWTMTGSFYLESEEAQRTPTFRIASAREDLFAPLLENSVFFYQVQRDGGDVNSSVYDRKPSHLTDKQARVYKAPTYTDDEVLKSIHAVKGAAQRDASGGWMDAGDYIKFVETLSYTVTLMLASVRDYPASAAVLREEARFGLDWLVKMWDSETKTLYIQVGIGAGNNKIMADHDTLRLPEEDDKLHVREGDEQFYIKYRPLIRAAEGGSSISPNLAGRMAAAFALGSQVWASEDSQFAQSLRKSAEDIFTLADTSHKQCNVDEKVLLTTSPWGFYPETEWCSDMQLGASALYALTGQNSFLDAAKHYSAMYMDTYNATQRFNLYDVAALAHAHLVRELPASDPARSAMLANLEAGLVEAQRASSMDVFGLGKRYDVSTGDAVPEILGLAVSGLLYDDLAGSERFGSFVQSQIEYVLGANGWGVSFVIGAAADVETGIFPKCPQHNIDNIMGLPAGSSLILLGAVVDGPSSDTVGPDDDDLYNKCPAKGAPDPYKEFTRGVWSFGDNSANWAGTEPADDYTAMSVILWARLMNGRPSAVSTESSQLFFSV